MVPANGFKYTVFVQIKLKLDTRKVENFVEKSQRQWRPRTPAHSVGGKIFWLSRIDYFYTRA